MNEQQELVLKAFLSRSPKNKQLERHLVEHERAFLASLASFDDHTVLQKLSDEELFERVHWSWFLPTLKSFSAREQSFFLAALSPTTAEQLKESLAFKGKIETVTAIGRQFLREQLLFSIGGPGGKDLPSGAFCTSSLNQLLSLSKKQLTRLIDLLALYDLTIELRQIVETKILKKIYSVLTDEQKTVLKQLGSQKESPALARLNLDRWNGDDEALRHLLHRRGLTRFSMALSQCSADLIWSICHQLDIGRGTALFRLCNAERGKVPSEEIAQQVLELLRFL